jgi:uncharacterized protein YdiU (UPF0061 family)
LACEAHGGDQALGARLLALMQANRVDYTNLFRDLAEFRVDDRKTPARLRDRFADRAGFDAWAADYRARLRLEDSEDVARGTAMRSVNPRYILRNYLAQQAIEQAEQGDYGEVERLLGLLARPFDDQPGMAAYAAEPPEWGRCLEVGCSS